MAESYQKKTNERYRAAAVRLLDDSPYFLRDFYSSMVDNKSELTRLIYLHDARFFIERYLMQINKGYKDIEIEEFPVEVFSCLALDDIRDYKTWLKENRKLSDASVRIKVASVLSFFDFLSTSELCSVNNDILSFKLDTAPAKRKETEGLSSGQIDKLLSGVRKNDLYLVDDTVLPIDDKVLLKRERLVLRNIAILQLLIGTDMKVSEIASLDTDDILFGKDKCSLKVGNNYIELPEDVASSLREYYYGPVHSPTLSSGISEFDDFAKDHISDTDSVFEKNFKKAFPEADANCLVSTKRLTDKYRRHGRSGFKPALSEYALFITSRGSRMSVRMIEMTTKELIRTYLGIDDFNPSKLRNSRSKNITTKVKS